MPDGQSGLHSEQRALPGEHRGRASNPIVKVHDLAWVEFQRPDLDRVEAFAWAFGFRTSLRTHDTLYLRGTAARSACLLIRRGSPSRFIGLAFEAADREDLRRLADATCRPCLPLPESLGGMMVELVDPSGVRIRVVSGTHALTGLPAQKPLTFNVGSEVARVNFTQRPPLEPARVRRLGHVVLQTTRYRETLDWYLEHLGLIVSDFLYYQGQRERGPVMSFLRCDRGGTPTDHHSLALVLGPANRYLHSAYEVTDLDALAAGGEYLLAQGYRRSWGIGRHILGSQLFDYWRDPDGFLVEHFTDGDLFDCTLEPGWAPMTASGLAQWGPPATRDFLGLEPGRQSLRDLWAIFQALCEDNEFDLHRLGGLLKAAST